jgi:hypothetical protein
MRNALKILLGYPEGKRLLERPILKWILKNSVWVWPGFIWLMIKSNGRLL